MELSVLATKLTWRFSALLNFHCRCRFETIAERVRDRKRNFVNSNRKRNDFLHRFKCGSPSIFIGEKIVKDLKTGLAKHIQNIHSNLCSRRSTIAGEMSLCVCVLVLVCKNSARAHVTALAAFRVGVLTREPIRIVLHLVRRAAFRDAKQIVRTAKLSSYLPLGLFWSSLYNTKSKDFPS